jgi:hypothetical protein
MLDEYEESFYYDKPSSTGTNVSGEAVGMGLGLGAGIVTGLLSGIMLLLTRLDILSSGILGLLFYMLTYKNGWPAVVYIFAVVAIIAASVILQHRFIVVRIIYGVFMCVVASLLGPAIIGYDSEVRMYTIIVRRRITIGCNSKLNFRLTPIRPRGLACNCTFLSA